MRLFAPDSEPDHGSEQNPQKRFDSGTKDVVGYLFKSQGTHSSEQVLLGDPPGEVPADSGPMCATLYTEGLTMKCLIIASGRGSRLRSTGDSKPLVRILGLPLLERVILTARKGGATEFYVVTGYRGNEVRKHLKQLSETRGISITNIHNDEWKKENGMSVLKAKDFLKDNFILLMTDHVFDESILVKMMKERINGGEVILAVDRNTKTGEFHNDEDFTKALVKGDRIVDIGKDIQQYNAYDTGIFLCSPAVFTAIEESMHDGDSTLSGAMRVLAREAKARALDIDSNFWIDVDDEGALKQAERRLLSSLDKASDGPISRCLNRPISTRISRALVRTRISPNLLSFLSFALCCMGASLFFLGKYPYLLLGGILAQISSIADGVDGEIARLKFQQTDFGAWFDAVLDRYADAFLIFGLTYYAYTATGSLITLVVGFLAIIGSFVNSYTADKYDGLMAKKLGSNRRYFRIGRDLRLLIVFLFAVLNLPFLAILLLALMMNGENIRRIVILYRNG